MKVKVEPRKEFVPEPPKEVVGSLTFGPDRSGRFNPESIEGLSGGLTMPLDSKPTNPKDLIATNKLPLSCVPEILAAYAAMGFLEGALKYGRYNWRISGVRSSIYIDALKRHIAAYESGEDLSENGVPHFSNMLACIGIILDARACGKLVDDRPPKALRVPEIIRSMEADVARLREKFKDHHPHQYTIADSPEKL